MQKAVASLRYKLHAYLRLDELVYHWIGGLWLNIGHITVDVWCQITSFAINHHNPAKHHLYKHYANQQLDKNFLLKPITVAGVGFSPAILSGWNENAGVKNQTHTGLMVDSYLLPTSKSRETKSRTKIKNPAPISFRYCPLI